MSAILDAVTPEMIAQCETLIRPHIRRTPVIEVDGAEFDLPAHRLTLKLELTQHAGSFKTRGAFANLLSREVPAAGVVAASGGNHGAAVAYAAMKLGKPAKIFIPTVSSPAKVQRTATTAPISPSRATAMRMRSPPARPGCGKPAPCRCRLSIRSKPSWAREHSAANSPNRRLIAIRFWCRSAAAAWSPASPPGMRPHQRRRRRAVCLADPDQGTGSRTPCRCRSRWPGSGFAGAAARRRKGVSDRSEIRPANRAGA